jgi:hypothetical protein
MTEARVAFAVVAVIAVLVVIAIVVASGPMTPESFSDGREGPGDVIDNDHDDYPHDCLIGDPCTPFPMPSPGR